MSYNLISIIIPVYNQADHIDPIVEDYINTLAHIPYKQEYILVVNACRDNSLAVCRELMSRYEIVKVLHCERGGWGFAVKRGLHEAQGDLICYTNGARTSSQDLMLFLLYGVANQGVIIKANRKIRENWKRRVGSLLYNIECRTLFDLSYWDINGTPKVFPRRFDKLLKLSRDDDLIDLEFNIICRRENYPILEVPIFSTKRHSGMSTTNYRSAIGMYWGAYMLWRKKP